MISMIIDGVFQYTATKILGLDNNLLQIKTFEIGVWNMDTTASVAIVHGVDKDKIIAVNSYIIDDAAVNHTPFVGYFGVSGQYGGDTFVDATNINLTRRATGIFDSVSYDDGAMNRGFVHLLFKP